MEKKNQKGNQPSEGQQNKTNQQQGQRRKEELPTAGKGKQAPEEAGNEQPTARSGRGGQQPQGL